MLKKLLAFLALGALFVSCMDNEVDISKKQVRNGIVYEVNDPNPFTGKFVGNYDNGQLKISEIYENGIAQGVQSTYYKNGQLKEQVDFVNGKPNGVYTNYYKNGNIFYRGTYENGLKNGAWEVYTENNKPVFKQIYQNGKLVNVEQYIINVDKIKDQIQSIFN